MTEHVTGDDGLAPCLSSGDCNHGHQSPVRAHSGDSNGASEWLPVASILDKFYETKLDSTFVILCDYRLEQGVNVVILPTPVELRLYCTIYIIA